MVYAKKIVGDVKLTTYGRVLYTNLLASIPCGVSPGIRTRASPFLMLSS